MKLTVKLTGNGWERFTQRLNANLVGAREMAGARFLIGSRLPYASRWIEEGVRDDPRLGRVMIKYRSPADTRFMQDSVRAFGGGSLRRRRPTTGPLGGVFDAAMMELFAEDIADSMRQILNAEVYSHPIPMYASRPRWRRTHALYNSIRAYRV